MPPGSGLWVSGIRSPSGKGHDPSMNNTTTLDPRVAAVREFVARVTEDGKISEQWAFEDMAAIGRQLGVFTLPWAG
jgi:hypothetical protein